MIEAASAGARGAPPRWVTPYLPRFQEILHALSLVEGFALMPVEVPSEDVAHALATWLTAEGRPGTVIEPRTEEAWRGVTSTLFEVKPGPEGVVMVIGPRGEPPGMMWGFGLLNQRRDSMGKHLGCPLLWCGPWEFLGATWRAAPDLWSVADVPKRLEAPGRAPPSYPMEWTGGGENLRFLPEAQRKWLSRLQEELRQLRQRDKRLSTAFSFLAFGILDLASRPDFVAAQESLPEPIELEDSRPVKQSTAEIVLLLEAQLWLTGFGKSDTSGKLLNELSHRMPLAWTELRRGQLMLVRAQILAFTGQAELARVQCEEALPALRSTQDSVSEAYALRVLGYVHAFERQWEEAERAYHAALKLFRRMGLRRGEAHVLRGLGDLWRTTDRFTEARQLYEQALALYHDLEDALGEANAQQSLGALLFLLEDFDEAEAAYGEALRLYRAIGVTKGERVTAERLAEVAGEKARPGGA